MAVYADFRLVVAADWNSSFRTNFDSTQPSFGEFGDFSAGDDDEDEFGDFTAAQDGDYDFSQTVGPTSPLKSSFSPPTPLSPTTRPGLNKALSAGEEVVGPGVHQGAHISKDGLHVEAEVEVDGKTVKVQVPRDELALHPEMIDEEQAQTKQS